MENSRIKIKRIGIDARFYGPEQKGLGRYTQEVVDGVTNIGRENEYVIFLSKANYGKFVTDNPKVKKVLADIKWYSLSEQILMPLIIRRAKVDLMHFQHFNVPLFCFKKYIVTIHDLILIKHPTQRASTLGPWLYRLKNTAYRIVIRIATRRAKKIIAVSEYTRRDIIKQFNVDPDKVVVTYEGVTRRISRPINQNDKKVVLRYNIHKPFLLYVGNAYPHKNLEKLIQNFPEIKEKSYDLQLVLVGKDDYFYSRLKKLAKTNKYASDVIFPGFIEDNHLVSLYSQAEVYVFPTLFEGFGLPPLEAMQYGCPVLSSNRTCLPEILGGAALYFDPQNTIQLVNQTIKLLSNQDLRSDLVKRGYQQVKKYSWQECSRNTLKLYNKI